MRIPIGHEDDDRVGCLQVQPEAAGARRKQEDEVLRVGLVENLEHVGALVALGHAVKPEEPVAFEVEVVLDNGHALGHLAEHQDLERKKQERLLVSQDCRNNWNKIKVNT